MDVTVRDSQSITKRAFRGKRMACEKDGEKGRYGDGEKGDGEMCHVSVSRSVYSPSFSLLPRHPRLPFSLSPRRPFSPSFVRLRPEEDFQDSLPSGAFHGVYPVSQWILLADQTINVDGALAEQIKSRSKTTAT